MHREMSYYLNVLIGVRYNCSNFCWNGFEYISTELKYFSKRLMRPREILLFFSPYYYRHSAAISYVNNDTAHKAYVGDTREQLYGSYSCVIDMPLWNCQASLWAVSRKPPSGGRLAASGQVNMHMMCLCTEENLTTYDFHIIVKIQCGTVWDKSIPAPVIYVSLRRRR